MGSMHSSHACINSTCGAQLLALHVAVQTVNDELVPLREVVHGELGSEGNQKRLLLVKQP